LVVNKYIQNIRSTLERTSSGKFNLWAGNGSCVEDVRKSYKDANLEGIKRYVHKKILIKIPDPE